MPDLADIRATLNDLLSAIDVANVEALLRSAMVDEALVPDEDRAVLAFDRLRLWAEV